MRNFRPHACDFESISLERDTVDPYQIEHDFVTIWGFFPFFRYFLKKASCIANYDFWKKPVQSNKISYIAESEVHFNGKKHWSTVDRSRLIDSNGSKGVLFIGAKAKYVHTFPPLLKQSSDFIQSPNLLPQSSFLKLFPKALSQGLHTAAFTQRQA